MIEIVEYVVCAYAFIKYASILRANREYWSLAKFSIITIIAFACEYSRGASSPAVNIAAWIIAILSVSGYLMSLAKFLITLARVLAISPGIAMENAKVYVSLITQAIGVLLIMHRATHCAIVMMIGIFFEFARFRISSCIRT